jgi:hypothetical protein
VPNYFVSASACVILEAHRFQYALSEKAATAAVLKDLERDLTSGYKDATVSSVEVTHICTTKEKA